MGARSKALSYIYKLVVTTESCQLTRRLRRKSLSFTTCPSTRGLCGTIKDVGFRAAIRITIAALSGVGVFR
ncbi:methyltransferase fkbM domain-containing protein [Pochonia chlamydosporia 170]|uniref:Methyltransferase fkbM domain-containing protein n=1 Tax=Pochonia chlamydosporia 170 TaxID=1380566 RepID=A0A179F5T0_METCM|nr:methyltransferase fkbM domain-containing protein [Pochonia chlamydosporia 170]OAQ60785.2 methyltransferase fkbM domain-containing protein [Pochonia chlamydosporia 170]